MSTRIGRGRKAINAGAGFSIEPYALTLAWLAVIIVFGAIKPGVFLTTTNLTSVLSSQSVLVLVTLAVLPPLTVGDLDVSVGSVVGLSAMVLLVLNTQHGFNPYLAAILAILVAAVVGLVNGVLVTWLQIDALVITLGSGSVVAGVTAWVSNQQTLIGLPAGFEKIVISSTILGVAPSFYYSLLLVLVIAYLAHLTPLGRRMLVVGQAREVATLSGIRVNRVRIGCLVGCSALAGLAGVIYAGTSGSASPSGGAELLLPAYAAAFLGATTVTPGRFNAVGALIAVCFLATGVNGLQLLGAPNFVQQLFYGASLIVAAAVSIIAKRHRIASQEIS